MAPFFTYPVFFGVFRGSSISSLVANWTPIVAIDIQGRRPTSPTGKRYRPEFWSWRPIHALIGKLCSDLFNEKALAEMAFNRGGGPLDQQTCTAMAGRFEQWMEHHAQGFSLESGIRVTEEGRFVSEEDLAKNPSMETVSAYEVSDDELKRWIEFLRHCGGFEVW